MSSKTTNVEIQNNVYYRTRLNSNIKRNGQRVKGIICLNADD